VWLARLLSVAPLRNTLVAATVTNPPMTRRLLLPLIATPSAATDERVAMFQRPFVVSGSTSAVGEWLAPFVTRRERSRSTEVRRYASLTMPTLVLWGDRDEITPPAQGRHIASLIPGAELAVLPTAGHIPAIEDPGRFNAALVDFLVRRVPVR
jgi:pimeloyl-ACP methyl ester carboxylesterase